MAFFMRIWIITIDDHFSNSLIVGKNVNDIAQSPIFGGSLNEKDTYIRFLLTSNRSNAHPVSQMPTTLASNITSQHDATITIALCVR